MPAWACGKPFGIWMDQVCPYGNEGIWNCQSMDAQVRHKHSVTVRAPHCSNSTVYFHAHLSWTYSPPDPHTSCGLSGATQSHEAFALLSGGGSQSNRDGFNNGCGARDLPPSVLGGRLSFGCCCLIPPFASFASTTVLSTRFANFPSPSLAGEGPTFAENSLLSE